MLSHAVRIRYGATMVRGSTVVRKRRLASEKLPDADLIDGMDMKRTDRPPILIGNSFPLALIRRPATVTPVAVEALREAAADRPVASYWGHANTLAAAEAFSGLSLAPHTARPALGLSAEGYPELEGQQFTECWVLAPDYTPGFRPGIGEEIPPEKITGWQVLRIEWTCRRTCM